MTEEDDTQDQQLEQLRRLVPTGLGATSYEEWEPWDARRRLKQKALRDAVEAMDRDTIGSQTRPSTQKGMYQAAVEVIEFWGGEYTRVVRTGIAREEAVLRARGVTLPPKDPGDPEDAQDGWALWRDNLEKSWRDRIAKRALLDLIENADTAWLPEGSDGQAESLRLSELLLGYTDRDKPPEGKYGAATLLAKLNVGIGAMGLSPVNDPDRIEKNSRAIRRG